MESRVSVKARPQELKLGRIRACWKRIRSGSTHMNSLLSPALKLPDFFDWEPLFFPIVLDKTKNLFAKA
jgi:hypothetical protein